jgi:hypothetical protein
MTPAQPRKTDSTDDNALGAAVAQAGGSEALKAKIYQAISVQRPVVLGYLKSLRREKPNASATEILKELEKRYVATVTVTSTGVGASAAIPGVGVPIALGLGMVDLLFFYETSALYVLAAAELHGIEVRDAERARPLVFGMLLGEKSQSQITKIVLQAAGANGVNSARTVASGTLGKALPAGWGEVLTEQLPESALAPLATVIAKEALKASAKFGAGTLGKAIPFGLGAIIGGVGSFTFGRDVVKAAHLAFPTSPTDFPESLADFEKPDPSTVEPSRAVKPYQSDARTATDFGEAVWSKASDLADVVKGGAAGAVSAVNARLKRKDDDPED